MGNTEYQKETDQAIEAIVGEACKVSVNLRILGQALAKGGEELLAGLKKVVFKGVDYESYSHREY